MKQALFHGAIVEDLVADPLAPPHPELTKYLEPPKKVLKRANEAVDQCKTAFAITKGLIWINSGKSISPLCLQSQRESHDHAKRSHARQNDDDETLLLDRVAPSTRSQPEASKSRPQPQTSAPAAKRPIPTKGGDDSETEPESDDDVWVPSSKKGAKLPTPSPELDIVTDPQRPPDVS